MCGMCGWVLGEVCVRCGILVMHVEGALHVYRCGRIVDACGEKRIYKKTVARGKPFVHDGGKQLISLLLTAQP